jgi:hypothetical protein
MAAPGEEGGGVTGEAETPSGERGWGEGTVDKVLRGEAGWCVVHGDALHVLRDLPTAASMRS